MIVTHDVDPATPEGISRIEAIRHSAQEAVKGTPLAGSKIYIAGIASLSLILLIMLFITRSLVAALVIVGKVALSLGASFGMPVLVWQHILGVELYWVILPLAVILLLAVASD
jgi:RND superfamily putative drug exporter